MKLFTALFPDSNEVIQAARARDLWYAAYSLLRYNARYCTPAYFTHMDLPELNVTAARFTITETFTEDGKLHKSTSIERSIY